MARRARCDRALGVVETRHPRAADRRLGAARQDRARRMERCRARPHRRGLARPRAALPAAVRLARGPPTAARDRRSADLYPADAGAAAGGRRLAGLDPRDYLAEWKWDGIRVQLVARGSERRLYSRSGDDIGAAFPDICAAMPADVTLDGELLVIRDGEVAPFNDLQQRLNRKTPTPKLLRDFPAAVRLYDMSARGAGRPARPLLCRAPASARSVVCAGAAHGSRSLADGAVHQLGASSANCATGRASAASRG